MAWIFFKNDNYKSYWQTVNLSSKRQDFMTSFLWRPVCVSDQRRHKKQLSETEFNSPGSLYHSGWAEMFPPGTCHSHHGLWIPSSLLAAWSYHVSRHSHQCGSCNPWHLHSNNKTKNRMALVKYNLWTIMQEESLMLGSHSPPLPLFIYLPPPHLFLLL